MVQHYRMKAETGHIGVTMLGAKTREQVIEAITAAFTIAREDRCTSDHEREALDLELKEVLTWVKE